MCETKPNVAGGIGTPAVPFEDFNPLMSVTIY